MKIGSRGNWWRVALVLAPLALLLALALASGGPAIGAGTAPYEGPESGGCANCGPLTDEELDNFGLRNDLLYISNGRASNVAVLDIEQMDIVDYIPVPRAMTNVMAIGGQAYQTLEGALKGLAPGTTLPYHVWDMFYWEIHGVVPSHDRKSIYAQGALSFTPADNTLYQIDVKTRGVMSETTMTQLPSPSMVGYCGIEWDRNDDTSGVVWAENMQTGPNDLMALGGSPLQLRNPLADLAPALGLGGLINSVESLLPQAFGGVQEVRPGQGPGRFIATDWNGNLNSSTCGISWDKTGTKAYASQMFEPLTDKINWNTKQLTGDILPPAAYTGSAGHQSSSAKDRGLLFTAWGTKGVYIIDMNLDAVVGGFNVGGLSANGANIHGVEVSPSNENILYVTGDGEPWGGTYVIDVTNIRAPVMLGGVEKGIDIAACGTYAIGDKQAFYDASGRGRPDLKLFKMRQFWASFADYQARKLSVDFEVRKVGGPDAKNLNIVSIMNTNGVTTDTPLPIFVGDVTASSPGDFTVKYVVPTGVNQFNTKLTGTAEDAVGHTYVYPF